MTTHNGLITKGVGIKGTFNQDERCRTCDGLYDNGRTARGEMSVFQRRPTRPCPDCGRPTAQCIKCREWMASHWFNKDNSTTCTLCIDLAKRRRPWTSEETQRLYLACRDILNFWPRYLDQWDEEEMVMWRALLGAVERSNAGGE